MRIYWDVPIEMDDGLVLRAGRVPPGRGGRLPGDPELRPVRQGPPLRGRLSRPVADHVRESTRTSPAGSTNVYQNWEVVDPEKWVPARLRLRARRLARRRPLARATSSTSRRARPRTSTTASSGRATQPWSTGKVGLSGISYYGMNQWQVAALQPPHLAAMCLWEGAADWYRDSTHHGGHPLDLLGELVRAPGRDRPVRPRRDAAPRTRVTGELVCGDETLTRRGAGREPGRLRAGAPRPPARSTTTTTARDPGLVEDHGAAAVGRQLGRPRAAPARQHRGLRPRRLEAEVARAARPRALDALLHRLRPRAPAPLLRPLPARARTTAGTRQPRVLLQHPQPGEQLRAAARGGVAAPAHAWTKLLPRRARSDALAGAGAEAASVDLRRAGRRDHVLGCRRSTRRSSSPGRSAAKLYVSSTTADADLFLIFRVFDPDGEEVTFQGALDPHTPVAHGWLRASHRKLDPGADARRSGRTTRTTRCSR